MGKVTTSNVKNKQEDTDNSNGLMQCSWFIIIVNNIKFVLNLNDKIVMQH